MKLRTRKLLPAFALVTVLLVVAGNSAAQSTPETSPGEDGRSAAAADSGGTVQPLVSIKLMPRRILADEKRIWTYPVALAHGKGWMPTLAVLGITAGLVALDPHDTAVFEKPSFQNQPVVHGINHVLSGNHTALLLAAVPVTFYLAGLKHRDSYASQTALLAGEAVVNAEIATIVLKDISRRMRPTEVGPGGNNADTFFETKDRGIGGFGSFPSGHTSTAFAMATVFAERYRTHRWVPWVAYGLASVVGLSRLNEQAHYPSDIFFGAALGFSISHFVVLR